jgi:proline dehydrogenase
MGVVNRLLAAALPYAPDCLVRRIAQPYIAGEDRAAALAKAGELRAEGIAAMANLLGEDERDPAAVRQTLDEYLALARETDVSVKPTQLGLGPAGADAGTGYRNLLVLGREAERNGRTLWIDMEDHTYTDATLQLANALRTSGDCRNIGVALQARLKRTLDDLVAYAALPHARVRICKGIYLEPEDVGYTRQDDIDRRAAQLCETAFSHGVYAAMATHDERLIERGKKLLDAHGRDTGEFQLLLGVRTDLAKRLAGDGYRVNAYVPYGPWAQARKYCERRIRKNPNIAGYVLKNLVSRG